MPFSLLGPRSGLLYDFWVHFFLRFAALDAGRVFASGRAKVVGVFPLALSQDQSFLPDPIFLLRVFVSSSYFDRSPHNPFSPPPITRAFSEIAYLRRRYRLLFFFAHVPEPDPFRPRLSRRLRIDGFIPIVPVGGPFPLAWALTRASLAPFPSSRFPGPEFPVSASPAVRTPHLAALFGGPSNWSGVDFLSKPRRGSPPSFSTWCF